MTIKESLNYAQKNFPRDLQWIEIHRPGAIDLGTVLAMVQQFETRFAYVVSANLPFIMGWDEPDKPEKAYYRVAEALNSSIFDTTGNSPHSDYKVRHTAWRAWLFERLEGRVNVAQRFGAVLKTYLNTHPPEKGNTLSAYLFRFQTWEMRALLWPEKTMFQLEHRLATEEIIPEKWKSSDPMPTKIGRADLGTYTSIFEGVWPILSAIYDLKVPMAAIERAYRVETQEGWPNSYSEEFVQERIFKALQGRCW